MPNMMRLPGETLTVIIRDDAPLIHCGDAPAYRSVQITLTQNQRQLLALKRVGTNLYEEISKCFIEPAATQGSET